MFRPQIIRRSFSLVRNVHTTPRPQIVNSAIRDGHEAVRIQRVRFVRYPYFSRRRLIEFALYTAGTLAVFQYFLGDDDEDDVVEEHESTSKQRQQSDEDRRTNTETGNDHAEEEDDEDGDLLLSIPIGLARPKEREFYRGSDPEWQEFIKISKDKRRITDAKKILIDKIRSHAAQEMPQFVKSIGPIDTRKGNSWIEMSFPYGPPIEYERPVLEIDENLDVYYTTRTVHGDHYQRFSRAAYPTAAFTSVYELTKFKIGQSWQTIKSYAGYPERPPQIGPSSISIPRTSAKSSSEDSKSKPMTQTSTQNAESSSASNSTTSTANKSTQQQPTSPSKSPQGEQLTSSAPSTPHPNVSKLNLPVNPDPSMFTTPLSGFSKAYRKGTGPRPFVAPRGTLVMSGILQIVGSKGTITVDVQAAFSPQHDHFERIDYKVRSIQPHSQYPLRK